jgi:hypothetical protein
VSVASGTYLPSRCHETAVKADRIENIPFPTIIIVACVYILRTLPSNGRCFTESLLSYTPYYNSKLHLFFHCHLSCTAPRTLLTGLFSQTDLAPSLSASASVPRLRSTRCRYLVRRVVWFRGADCTHETSNWVGWAPRRHIVLLSCLPRPLIKQITRTANLSL